MIEHHSDVKHLLDIPSCHGFVSSVLTLNGWFIFLKMWFVLHKQIKIVSYKVMNEISEEGRGERKKEFVVMKSVHQALVRWWNMPQVKAVQTRTERKRVSTLCRMHKGDRRRRRLSVTRRGRKSKKAWQPFSLLMMKKSGQKMAHAEERLQKLPSSLGIIKTNHVVDHKFPRLRLFEFFRLSLLKAGTLIWTSICWFSERESLEVWSFESNVRHPLCT